jgi:hypothetical protein
MNLDLCAISSFGRIVRRRCSIGARFTVVLVVFGCGGKGELPDNRPEETSFVQDTIAPVEVCSSVRLTGNAELDAAYAEVRAMHFYRYGNEHPYCEATSHIMAHKGVVEHGLELKKLVIALREPYVNACGREPMFAWHTLAVLPSSEAKGGYLVLDPVYLCGIEPIADYLEWYVRSDCPNFAGTFAGCAQMTGDDWLRSKQIDPAAQCVLIETLPWHYDLINCRDNLGEPWDDVRLVRAYSYVRTDLTGTRDYASRPGASRNDYGCSFGGSDGAVP